MATQHTASQLPLDDPGEDLVGAAEIAQLGGVTRAAVANWRARGTDGFPAPVLETKAGPVYRRAEVLHWLGSRGLHPHDDADEPLGIETTLWATADKLRGSVDASQYRYIVLSLLFLRYVTGASAARSNFNVPRGAEWDRAIGRNDIDDLSAEIERVITSLERSNKHLKGVLPRVFGNGVLEPRRLSGLVDVIGRIPVGEGRDERDLLGRAYEYFLGRFASLEGRSGGEFYTPSSVVRLLVEVIETVSGTVYDPCCGSGGMFIQSLRFREAHAGGGGALRLLGQEMNANTWRLAQMNLALHGLQADLGSAPADTFHNDVHPSLRADYVLANPPFNMSDWGASELAGDPRWKYGLPPAGNANLAWVEHIISHLGDTGRAGIVLSNGSLSSDQSAEAAIRRALIEEDLVEGMVALPGQLFYSTTIPVTLWFIARDKTQGRDRRGKTLFIDARQLGTKVTRTHKVLTDQDVTRVASIFHAWRQSGRDPAEPGFAVTANLSEIRGRNFSLVPSSYVGDDMSGVEDSPSLAALAREYQALATQATALDMEIASALGGYVGD